MSDQDKSNQTMFFKDGRVLPIAELKVPMPNVAAPAPPAAPKAKSGS